MVHIALQERRSRDYEKEKPSPFLKNFLGQSQSRIPEPAAFDDLEVKGSAENPILLDEEEDKENSPPTTPVSERPTRPPAVLRSRPFGTRIESVAHYVYRILFH